MYQAQSDVRARVLVELEDYKEKAEILRQIHSNKAFVYQRRDIWQSTMTLVLSALLTFVGFTGVDNIVNVLALTGLPTNRLAIQFLFNTLVFLVLVAVLLTLVFKFQNQAALHNRSIVMLTSYIRAVNDTIRVADFSLQEAPRVLEVFRERYITMTEALPPSTDPEFLRSKRDYLAKRERSRALDAGAAQLSEKPNATEAERLRTLKGLLINTRSTAEALKAVAKIQSPECWITGGAIRSLVWTKLHDRDVDVTQSDVDVIYLDQSDTTESSETTIAHQLRSLAPSAHWSVRNQARMQGAGNGKPYENLVEAVQKFPDTASAIAVRQSGASDLEVIAPYGLEDLFRLVVRPTPASYKNPYRYEQRLREGRWQQTFPGLIVFHLEVPMKQSGDSNTMPAAKSPTDDQPGADKESGEADRSSAPG